MPLPLVILSPANIPTSLAGDGIDLELQTSFALFGIHSLTASTVLVTEVTQTDEKSVSNRINPITKCKNEPAPKTIKR